MTSMPRPSPNEDRAPREPLFAREEPVDVIASLLNLLVFASTLGAITAFTALFR